MKKIIGIIVIGVFFFTAPAVARVTYGEIINVSVRATAHEIETTKEVSTVIPNEVLADMSIPVIMDYEKRTGKKISKEQAYYLIGVQVGGLATGQIMDNYIDQEKKELLKIIDQLKK